MTHTVVPTKKYTQGFTLIELLVVVGIFAFITGVVFVQNRTFDNETLLHSLAYDVALSIRQAQNFGINVRGSEGVFDKAYGIHFTSGINTYQFFLDTDENGVYGGDSELLEEFRMGRGMQVATLCDITNSICDGSTDLTSVSIVFERPDPDAIIRPNQDALATPLSRLRIPLISPRGGERRLVVESTGQIAIQVP